MQGISWLTANRSASQGLCRMEWVTEFMKGKGKAISVQTRGGRVGSGCWGSQISRHSAHEGGNVIATHRPPLPPGNIPDTHFCYMRSRPQVHSAAGMIMSVKKSEYASRNRTRDLLICSAVPEPTECPSFMRIHDIHLSFLILYSWNPTTRN